MSASAAAVFAGVALAVAGPDLVTVAGAARALVHGGSRWWLVLAVAIPHVALIAAAVSVE